MHKAREPLVKRKKSQGRALGSISVLGARRRALVFQEMSKKSQKEEGN